MGLFVTLFILVHAFKSRMDIGAPACFGETSRVGMVRAIDINDLS
jgi:hypothetical protein